MHAEPIAGRYQLVEELSSGGMGQVWRGYDGTLDREVAIKVIRRDVISSAEQADEFASRFRREARITARIHHHGVPQVYDAVLDRSFDQVYLVMELVHGTSLRAFIDPQRPLPISWAAAVAAQVSTVLSHAHAIPVVHRDLKPENVLVSESGAIKLLDFGIAAILRTDVTRLTSTGNPIGTNRYMPPEQIQGVQISPQSDLYALGCVLHELLSGKPVFDAGQEFQLMQQHVYDSPQALRELRPDVPEALELLVLDLLAKVPEQRPADAFAVYERLLPFLPLPGTTPLPAERGPQGLPDPTLLYRRPNSPRSRPVALPQPAKVVVRGPQAVPDTLVRNAIKVAVDEAKQLLDQERFNQAAEVLERAIGPAADALGSDNPRVLRVRQHRAAILIVGGDFRRALPEFESLATAYSRTGGPTSTRALDCRRQAALCRAELGQATAALREFQQVLAIVRAADGDGGQVALELRRDIGMMLLAEGKTAEAEIELEALYEDLLVLNGPDHEESMRIGDVLARLRLAGG
jgi:serine/threonine protein kinase